MKFSRKVNKKSRNALNGLNSMKFIKERKLKEYSRLYWKLKNRLKLGYKL